MSGFESVSWCGMGECCPVYGNERNGRLVEGRAGFGVSYHTTSAWLSWILWRSGRLLGNTEKSHFVSD